MKDKAPIETDVFLVGAGPIGMEIGSLLKRNDISYTHVDKGPLGNTIFNWAPNTTFFSSPEWTAIAGIPIQTVRQERITGEDYCTYLRQVAEILDLQVNTFEEVTDISSLDSSFLIRTKTFWGVNVYLAKKVILATGEMSRPNLLGLTGESAWFVSHSYKNPHYYFRKRVLVVGGGNSAFEGALRLWRAGAEVTISYRREQFIKEKILKRLYTDVGILIDKGQIKVHFDTQPLEFNPGVSLLQKGEQIIEVPVDFVFCATGYRQDKNLYEMCRIRLEGEERHPVFNPDTMETNVPGIFVAGTAVAGDQQMFKTFITNCHVHGEKILKAIKNGAVCITGNLPGRNFPISSGDLD